MSVSSASFIDFYWFQLGLEMERNPTLMQSYWFDSIKLPNQLNPII